MKNLNKSENEAIVLTVLYVVGFGVGCYNHSFSTIAVITAFFITLLACSWRIERLEKRIDRYRKTLDLQMRDHIKEDDILDETPRIKVTKVS